MSNTTPATETELARNFEVHVFDATTDFAVDLDVDTATAVLREAGLPIVGLARKLEFDGAFWVDVPQSWYDALEESGDDFDGQARGYSVHATMY